MIKIIVAFCVIIALYLLAVLASKIGANMDEYEDIIESDRLDK